MSMSSVKKQFNNSSYNSCYFFWSLDVIEGSKESLHIQNNFCLPGIYSTDGRLSARCCVQKNLDVNVSFLIKLAIPGYYMLMDNISVFSEYFLLCINILGVAFGNFL